MVCRCECIVAEGDRGIPARYPRTVNQQNEAVVIVDPEPGLKSICPWIDPHNSRMNIEMNNLMRI